MRFLSLIKKEFLSIKNDRKSAVIVFIFPFLLTFLFANSVNFEVNNISLGVLNFSNSKESERILKNFEGTKRISKIYMLTSFEEAKILIDSEKITTLVIFNEDFARNKKVEVIVDGRNSNASQITLGYITSMINEPQFVKIRYLYNPNVENFWWILPNLIGLISMAICVIMTAMSIPRELELGTMEQILVSPLKHFEILLGKLTTAFLIGLIISFVIFVLMITVFDVPFFGSFWLLFFGISVFVFSTCATGIAISVFAKTQQQAILYSCSYFVPSILLSGFATPIENMPSWLIPVANCFQLKHYAIFIKSVILKDTAFTALLPELSVMLVLGIFYFILSFILFKKRF